MTKPPTGSLNRGSADKAGKALSAAPGFVRGNAFILMFAFAAILLCAGIASGIGDRSQLADEEAYLEIRIERIRAENEDLGKEIESLEDDPYYAERVVRKELKYARSEEYRLMEKPVQTSHGRDRED